MTQTPLTVGSTGDLFCIRLQIRVLFAFIASLSVELAPIISIQRRSNLSLQRCRTTAVSHREKFTVFFLLGPR
jgi:hypothetical protein